MPKQFPANAIIEANEQYGTEPIVIVEIEWQSGTEQYGDKSFPLGSMNVQGKLINGSPVSSNITDESSGEFSSFSVMLADNDSTIKAKVNSELVEGTIATVYNHFDGLAESDLVVLLKGRIYGDIVWDESERTLEFTVEQFIEAEQVGYSLEEDEIPDQSDEAEDKAWPMGFGTVVHVPALRIIKAKTGELVTTIDQDTISFKVTNGDQFPQDTFMQIGIGGILYTGEFSGKTFTATSVNDAKYTNLVLAERPIGDVHFDSAAVFWLEDPDVYLQGRYVLINHSEWGYTVNYCVKQIDTKCIFRKAWTNDSGGIFGTRLFHILMDENDIVEEAAAVVRISWPVTYRFEVIRAPLIGNPGFTNFTLSYDYTEVWQSFDVPQGKYKAFKGASVRQIQTFDDTYIFNAIPSVRVLQVFGYRNFDGEQIFTPIPSSYYIKNLNNSIAGQSPSTLEFPLTLEERTSEEWDGNVYVSYVSSVGPNAANIIKFIVETYSNLVMDNTTYQLTRQAVSVFPANFAIFNQPEALSFAKQIAYLARIAFVISNGEVELKYLSEIPITDATITEEGVQLQTLKLGFKTIEDIVTRIDATFVTDYSGREENSEIFSYKNNINSLGLIREEMDWFIYTDRELVKMSVGFWGNRVSNIWRTWKYNTFIENMDLQIFDVVNNDIEILSENSLRGEVELASQDTENASLELEGTLASKAGESTDGQPIEDLSYWGGDPAYPIDNPGIIDPCPGCEESDDPVNVPGNALPTPSEDVVDPPAPAIAIRWDAVPRLIQRGSNFMIRASIVNADATLYDVDVTPTLTLSSADISDVLSGPGNDIFGGIYVEDALQINGGAGNDAGLLTLTVPVVGLDPSNSPGFTIYDVPAFVASCSYPAAITRFTGFSLVIQNGEPGKTLRVDSKVSIAVDDLADILYIAGTDTPVDTITLDVAGNFNFPGITDTWEYRGGQQLTNGLITLIDPNTELEPPVPPTMLINGCPSFQLSGISPVVIEDNFKLEDEMQGNASYCELTVPASVENGIDFELSLDILEFGGLLASGFNGFVTIIAHDSGNNDLQIQWIKECENTENFSHFIIGDILAGEYLCAGLRLELTGVIGPIRFEAGSIIQDDNPQIVVQCEGISNVALAARFSVVTTANWTRGLLTSVAIQALNADGTDDIAYVPFTNVGINLNSTDGGDTITPLFTDNTGWVNGAKTVSLTINGGAGSDSGVITATDIIGGLVGEVDIAIAAAATLIGLAGFREGLAGDGNIFGDLVESGASWLAVQAAAVIAFNADTGPAYNNQNGSGQFRKVDASRNGAAQYDYNSAMRLGFTPYTITVPQRSGAVSWVLRTNAHQFTKVAGPPANPAQYSVKAGQATLKIFITETANFFGSGAALAAMTPIISYSYAEITNQHKVLLNSPGFFAPTIEVPLPLSFLASMVGTAVYIWAYVDWVPAAISYDANYQGLPNPGTTEEQSWINQFGLTIYK